MNLKVRLKNKAFWITFVPLVILLIKQIASLFGIELDLSEVQHNLINIIATVFLILGAVGVANDPTTAGLSDSEQAKTYSVPRKDDDSNG